VNELPEQYRKLCVESDNNIRTVKDLLKNIARFYEEYLKADTLEKIHRAYSRIFKYGPLKIEAGKHSDAKGFACHLTKIFIRSYSDVGMVLGYNYQEGKELRGIFLNFLAQNPQLTDKYSRCAYEFYRNMDVCLPYHKIPFTIAFPLHVRAKSSSERYRRNHRFPGLNLVGLVDVDEDENEDED
jgi:hypothetical protein